MANNTAAERSHQNRPTNDIIIEAKRLLLNEQIDRLANKTLSEMAPDVIQWNQSIASFHREVSFINAEHNTTKKQSNSPSDLSENKYYISPPHALNPDEHTLKEDIHVKEKILHKYFNIWRMKAKSKHLLEKDEVSLEGKLNNFIDHLKNHRASPTPFKVRKNPYETEKTSQSFKNRYKSQKRIIDVQRSKIEEQNKIINELKLGIIREDLLKSIESTKIEIRDIFSNCSQKLIIKAPLMKDADEREKIMIQCQKAPKMMQRMQQRALERAEYREVILERKRLIEETRQRLLEEAIERKKVMEDEERKRNLILINERRQRELKLQKIRLEKKQETERKFAVANHFYEKVLVKQCFKKLFNNCVKSKENLALAAAFYTRKVMSRVFKAWLGYAEIKFKVKYDIADAHYEYKIMRRTFDEFKNFQAQSVRAMQVAEDLYDFRLTSNTFIHWHRYVCKQIMLEQRKTEVAILHNERKIMFQYFYLWRSLPVVLKLEKAKEEKKRKWREKVWEILPDYQPPVL